MEQGWAQCPASTALEAGIAVTHIVEKSAVRHRDRKQVNGRAEIGSLVCLIPKPVFFSLPYAAPLSYMLF